jgi:hypothetical protein
MKPRRSDGEAARRPDRSGDGRPFQAPTRRAFVAMLGATAAALALRDRVRPEVIRDPSSGRPIWIGH